jgi:hypothetical protein
VRAIAPDTALLAKRGHLSGFQSIGRKTNEQVGAHALAWARAAIVERDVRSYRLLQGMLAITRKHPRECVDRACATALKSRSFRFKTLRRLLEGEVERTPPTPRRLTQEHALIRPLSEYAVLATTGGQA